MGRCLFKTMARKIKFKDKEIEKHLKENKKIADEVNKIVEEWKKQDEYVKKLSTKMERIKEKIRPKVAEIVKKETELGEFEIVSGTKLEKDGVSVEIFDQVEMYKEQLRKKANESTEEKNT